MNIPRHTVTYQKKKEGKHQIMTGGNQELPCCETLREKQGAKNSKQMDRSIQPRKLESNNVQYTGVMLKQ
jgi:hypothetical protein